MPCYLRAVLLVLNLLNTMDHQSMVDIGQAGLHCREYQWRLGRCADPELDKGQQP